MAVRRVFFNIFVIIVVLLGQIGTPFAALAAKAPEETPLPQSGLQATSETASAVGQQPERTNPRPLQAPTADVSIGMPASVELGANFSFTVTFDNSGADPGYGPFIDIIFPVTGQDGNDGIDFISATYLGSSVESVVQTFPDAGGGTGCVDHPWLRDNTGAYLQVCGKAGDKLVSLKLPFGSFVPDQPPAAVTVNASLSNLADISPALVVKARGGYMFGATPLDDWCCGDTPIAQPSANDGTGWPSASVTPTVMSMTKTYVGPSNTSNETATGPNYPRQYQITVDVATGQTVNNIHITDTLPNDVQFTGYAISGATVATENSLPSTSSPGGTLDLTLNSVTGVAGNDVTVTINYYVPRLDASAAAVIDPSSGAAVSSTNTASVTGDWTPIDTRDTPVTLTADGVPGTATVMHRSLAIQKSVSNITDASNSPGDTLEYTLSIQVSDFFAFDQLVVTDVISDGQRVDSTFTPTLSVNGNGYTLSSTAFSSGNYDIACDYSGTAGPECSTDNTAAPNTGETTLTFNVSDELAAQSLDDRLVGGCVDPVAGSAAPDCSYNDGPTTVTITFRTVIQENFTDDYPSGDASVDQGDTLDDTATAKARLLSTDTFTPGPNVTDDAAASLNIAQGGLTKSIYAVNGSTTLPTDTSGNVIIKPGDNVTYRLTYTLPTGDEEDLTFEDYLPLPIFDVSDPDAAGGAGPSWTFSSTVGDMTPGVVALGPSDTFYSYMSSGSGSTGTVSGNSNHPAATIDPVVASDAAANKVAIYYPNYDDTRSASQTVDLLLTVTVSAEPFADGLFLTNQARASEGSTNNLPSTADSIVQVKLTEPVLVGSKGVVWTSNPNATFSQAVGPAGVTFDGTASPGPRWTGTINSSGLASNPIDANVSGVDAGDIVTFAIVIENQGTSLNGAFDITLRDILDTAFYQIPAGGIGLQVYYGDGSGPISWNGLGGGPDGTNNTEDDLFGAGIELVDSGGTGVCQAHDPNLGNNVILITYNLEVKPDVHPTDQGLNTAHIMSYAGTEGGPNHLAEDITDDAQAEVVADFTKTLENTEVITANNGSSDVVIGELVTYKLTATVPEGQVPNARLTDTLDTGLAYVSCTSVTAYSGGAATMDVTTDLASGSDFSGVCGSNVTVTNNGHDITFDLGNITNTNTDNTQAETIEVVYQAVVLNVSGNQSGTLLNNGASFLMDDGTGNTTLGSASAANVTVKEPHVTTTKSAAPSTTDAGNTVTFTVTLTSDGETTAYDVDWSDTLPSGLTYGGTLNLGACTVTTPPSLDASSAPTLKATGADLAPGESCEIIFDATVDYAVAPGQVITNTASTTWTSLDGDYTAARSTENTDSTERTGVGGALNDYASNGTADVTINDVAPDKYLIATSEAHTGDPGDGTQRVTIGEIVRYRLVTTLPEGTSTNFQIQDMLPDGVTYLDDGTAKAAFVSNGGISSASYGSLPIPAITDANCFLTGASADATTPAIPASCPALADNNVASTMDTWQDVDNFTSGADVIFKLGTLTNNDSDADTEYVIIEFNALVDNSSGSTTNDAGDDLPNAFRVFINGSQNGSDSNWVNLKVAEPHLTVDKNIVTPAADAGDPMVYRISITNDSDTLYGNSAAAAFDLTLSDPLSSYLNLNSVTIYTDGSNGSTTLAGTCGSTAQTVTDSSTTGVGGTAQVDITCLNPGEKVVVDINATVVNTAPAGVTIPNTAGGVASSLPGTGTASNPTGSSTPGGSGAADGERDSSGGVNDYSDSGAQSVTLSTPTIAKSVSPTQYTIGDQITFNLLVTLPEGVTQALEVYDNLPIGLEYVSHSVITTAAASGGLLTADFNGTLPAPTVTAPGGSGGDLTLTFGDTTTNADNDASNNAFLVQVVARVMNVTANQDGDTKTNTGTVRWTNPNTSNTDSVSDTATVSIIEPRITTTKSVNPTSGVDAGDTLTYTVRFTNTGNSPAYDVTATDTLAQGVAYDAGSVSCTDGTSSVAVTLTDNGATLDFDGSPAGSWDIPVSGYIDCIYTATARTSLYVDGAHTNMVDADWSSQDGTPTAPDVERVYDDSTTYNFDGTQDTDTASFTVPAPTIAKDDGGVTQDLIGDTIHFTLTITAPEGTLRDAVVTDHLPAGLKYVTGSQVVSGEITPSGDATGFAFSGSADGSGTSTLTWNFGSRPIFTDSNGDNAFTIEYDAVVANVSANQNAYVLHNDVYLDYTDAAGNSQQKTASAESTVTEPTLTVDKSISSIAPVIDAGGNVTYTITIAHDASSTATAYDVHFADTLPSQVTLNVGSITVSGGTVSSNASAGNTVDVTISDIAVGNTVTITYDATINTTVTAAQLVANTGDLEWTSQPGSNPDERDGSDGASGLNNYVASDTANFTAADNIALDKLTPSPTQYTVGEQVTFDLLVTLNEGTNQSVVVYDNLPAGLEYVSASVITSGAPLTAAFSDPAQVSSPTITPTAGSGGDVTVSFGDIVVTGDNDTTNNSFIVRVVARVVDDSNAVDGATLTNTAELRYNDASGPQTLTDSETISILEPQITTTKSASPTSGVQAGDTVTYTVRFTNTGNSTAYDVTAEDTLPANVTYNNDAACVDQAAAAVLVSASVSGGVLSLDGNPSGSWDIAPGNYIQCTYSVTANAGIPLGSSFTNTVDADWTSLDGAVAGERDYNDSGTPVSDGTQDTASSTFATGAPTTLTKDDGGVTQSMIGDTIHVTITINSPTGSLANTVITDVLPAGMKYVTGTQSVSGISAPTFTVSGPNDGTAATTLTWDFGTATVSSSPFTVEYDAVATNTSGNVDGTNLVNDVTFKYDDAGGTHTLTDSDDTTIVEAQLTVNKTIASIDATPDAGDTVTYQVVISNLNTNSNASGYDVHFKDVLPVQVALVNGSVNVTTSGGAAGVSDNSNPGTNTVDVTIADVPLDATVTITYNATIASSVTPGELIANTGTLTWTSQPGSNPDERDGSGGTINDYTASSSSNFNITDPYFAKSLVGSSEPSTTDPDFTIGEIVTFAIDVTLPEGITPALHIVDDLPAGLQYVVGSAAVDTTNFNGTIDPSDPTVTPVAPPVGSGDDLIITFNNPITVTADNDDTNNTLRLTLQAVVLDEAGNQDPGSLYNSAAVYLGTDTSGTPVSSSDNSETINIVEPDLTVSKAVDDPIPGYGQTITYTITVSHTANSHADAFDVVVTDTIPTGLTYVLGSATTPAGWAAAYDAATRRLTWTGDLPLATGSAALTYQVTVDGPPAPPNIGDTLTNSVDLKWTSLPGSDSNERTGVGGVDDYNQTASQDVTITNINLTLSKDDGGVTVNAGDTIIYTLNYANTGNKDATGVTITETVPVNTTFDLANSTAGWSCADNAPAGTTCTYTVGALAAGATGSVNFAVTVDNPLPDAVTQVDNTASIADDGTNGVEDTSDNTANDSTPTDAVPDLTITKDDGVSVVSAGSVLIYTLNYANVGTQDTVNVQITDTVPANTTFDPTNSAAGWVCDDAGGDGTNGTPGDLCTLVIGNLNAGDSGSTVIAFVVDNPLDPTVTSISNTAVIADDGSNGTDATPGNNDDTDVDTVTTQGNGRLSKVYVSSNQVFTSDPQVAIGEILTYEVTLTVPPGSMDNVTLTDVLDRGLAFGSCESITASSTGLTASAGTFANICAAPTVSRYPLTSTDTADDGRQVVWNFGTLTNTDTTDATLTVRYTVVVLDILDNRDGGTLANQAVWAWTGGSDSDTTPAVEIVEPDLDITKSVNRNTVLPGETITFTLVVEHTAASRTDAFDVVLTDVLPGKLRYVPGSVTLVSGPSWDGLQEPTNTDPTLEITWAAFPLGMRAEITFEAILSDNANPGETVANAANVAWSSLPGDVSTPQSIYNTASTERYYDPLSNVNIYNKRDTAALTVPALPETGFAPNRVTTLPQQPEDKRYQQLDDAMRLEIPALGLNIPIIGVPLTADGWDLTWLSDQAGWLEGTAYPTWEGNTAITGHVYLADGSPGPFVNLGSLFWGQQIIIHAYGQQYIYEVRAVRKIFPDNLSVLGHKDRDWLTLVTCKDFNERTGEYAHRVAVQAVLVDVQPEP